MDDKSIEKLFSERNVRYRIPIYQRHYVWENNNWQHLWDDLREKADTALMGETVKSHFTGVIVIRKENEIREIVDGQQRLTTFQIILCVIRDLCKEANYNDLTTAIDELLEGKSNSDLDPAANYKLLPTAESDREAFQLLIERKAEKSRGRIHNAYEYFRKKIKAYIDETKEENKRKDKIQNLRNVFLGNFHVVELPLTPQDEAAKVFEALNGRGRALSQFDHLRNNVFLRAGTARKTLYSQYWKHFNEKDWQLDEVADPFLENFLKAKLGQDFDNQLPQFDLYQRVYRKKLCEKLKLDEDSPKLVKREFKELKRYSDVYSEITNCDQGNPLWFYQLLETIFKITGWLPLILLLKSEKEELQLSDDTLKLVLRSLESYIVRCMLYGPKRNLTEPVDGLISLIKNHNNFSVENIVKYLREKWPTDKQVKPVLRKMGTKKRRFTKYILFQIEGMITDPSRSEVKLTFDEQLNIEHVMPQKWQKTWALPKAEEFSHEARAQNAERARDRDQHLQSIGNLTLLTEKLNSELENQEFPKKQPLYQEHSRLKITRKISDSETGWDVPQIREREANLAKLFCKIWPSAEGVLNHQWQSMITGDDNPKLTVLNDLCFLWDSMITKRPHILVTSTGHIINLSTNETDKDKATRILNAEQTVLAYSQEAKDKGFCIAKIPSLENVPSTPISNKQLRSYQQSASCVQVVTRYKHLLQGTIESFDTDAIYVKIKAQTVIVYRNNIHTVTKNQNNLK